MAITNAKLKKNSEKTEKFKKLRMEISYQRVLTRELRDNSAKVFSTS